MKRYTSDLDEVAGPKLEFVKDSLRNHHLASLPDAADTGGLCRSLQSTDRHTFSLSAFALLSRKHSHLGEYNERRQLAYVSAHQPISIPQRLNPER